MWYYTGNSLIPQGTDVQKTVMLTQTMFLLCLVLCGLCPVVHAQRSIVFVHGVLSDTGEFDTMRPWIEKDYPNVTTYSLTPFPNLLSLEPMWKQVEGFSQQLQVIMRKSPDGVKLICFSQGGLICRGMLSTVRHNVDTFIALSCPLAGQFGDTSYLKPFFHDIVKEEAYLVLYNTAGQLTSVGNYWNDPHHQSLYIKWSRFLAVLNNETNNPNSTEMRQNFLRLEKLVLVGGPQDEIIGPWQSSHFGFYDSTEDVQPMTKQMWYKNDAFGLRTLAESGKVHIYTVEGIHHTHWPRTLSVYQQCIKPWLG